MKRKIIILAVFALTLSITACKTEQAKPGKTELTSLTEKASYAIGQDFGKYLQRMPVEIDIAVLTQAMDDTLNNRESLLTFEEIDEAKKKIRDMVQEQRTKEQSALSEKNKTEGEAFFADNKNKDGVITTASGLQYIVLEEGDGPSPTVEDRVTVHYQGALLDGTEFDSSYKRDEPYSTLVKGVIPGWVEALQLMKVGSKFRLFIPSDLGYGEFGKSQVIGPNAALIFEVELLEIERS